MNNKGGRLHFSITADNEDVKRKLAETRQGIINSGKAAEEQGSKIEGMFKRAALAAGAFFTVQQAASFAKQIAVVRGEFQQLEVAFTTMLGSASAGKAMMQDAIEIAAKTPFDLKGVAQGAKQLLAYGSASQDVGKELVMLGNIAAGLSIPLNDMVYLYGTTQTQGRLFTQDLRQFMGRGIPLADELAKQFGVTKEQVGELVTAGKVGFPEVQKALQAMTADGGKFNNLMEEQSKTITGQISNLGDSIDVMFNKIGTSQEGLISDIIGGATSLVENYETVGREIGALVVTYGAYKAAVISFAAVQKTVTTIKHTEEAAELAKLLTVEQQANISKLGLAKTSAKYAAAVKSEVVAEMEKQTQLAVTTKAELEASQVRLASADGAKKRAAENVAVKQAELTSIIGVAKAEQIAAIEKKIAIESEKQSRAALEVVKLQSRKNDAISQAQHLKEMGASTEKIAAKNREIAVIAEKIAVSKAEEIQHSRNIVSLRAEKLAINDSIASKATLKAQAALETAQQELNTSSLARNAAAREVGSKRAVIDSAVRRANTLETGVNTASQAANATATGFLSVAKIKLTAITAKLNDVITKNPYAIAAVAIAALAYGIYKLCTAQSAAERAQEAFNEKIEEGKKKQDEFVSKTNELIGVIRTETNTRYMQTKAFKELNDKYPELLKNMSMEKLLLMDNIELQKFLAQYTEGQDKKGLFAGLDEATRRLDRAKKSLSEFQNRAQTSWELMNDGKKGEDDYVKRVQYAEEYLKQWQDKLKKHRQIEADARPVDVKTADLSQNIILLENQLAEVQRLQDEAKKNNPFGWNLYELQIGAINAQISAKKGELKVLNNDTAQTGQDKNKAYWEAQKKNAQEALEAMGEAKKNTKEWNAEIAKINQASSKLKQWDVSGKGDAKDANTLKKLAQEKQEKGQFYTDLGFAVRQAEINAMSEGLDKVLAQNDLNYRKEIEQIKRQKEDKLTKIQGWERTIWESQNPNWEKQGKKFKPQTTALSKDDNKQFEVMNNSAFTTLTAGNKKAYETALNEYAGFAVSYIDKANEFEDNLKNLASKHKQERANLISSGASKEAIGQFDQKAKQEVDAVTAVQKELLAELDEQMEVKSQTFILFAEQIANMGIQELKLKLDEAEQLLAQAQTAAGADGDQTSVIEYQAQIRALKQQIVALTKKSDKKEDATSSDALAKHKAALKTVNELGNAAKDIAGAFEGLDGDLYSVIDSIGTMSSSVGSMLSTIELMGTTSQVTIAATTVAAGTGVVAVSTVATTAIKGVEKASVILAIIGAALQIITAIAKTISGVFNGDKKKEKEIKGLQEQVDALGASYKRLGKAIDKAYSADAAALIKEQDANLCKKKALIEEQIRLEESKKKTDHEKVNQLKQEIEVIDDELEQTNRRLIEAFVNTDVKSAISEFADAYVDAWAAGEDKAAAMKDVVRKMVKSAVIELVKSRLSPEVTQFMEFLAKAMEDGILTSAEEAALDEFERRIYTKAESIDQNFGKYIKDEDADKREASQKGFTSMSQDSANELNGSFAAMHGILFDVKVALFQMLELQKQNLPQLQHLTHLSAISENTAYCRRLEGIEKDMSSMKNDINTIVSRGIKIKKEI